MQTSAVGITSQKVGVKLAFGEAGTKGGVLKVSIHGTSPWNTNGEMERKELNRAVRLVMMRLMRAIASNMAVKEVK